MALLPVSTALIRVLEDAEPLPAEQASLLDAHGRVLAENLAARVTQPPADVSAMDGYAVRAADVAGVNTRLRLIGEVAAGRPSDQSIGAGETMRIFTGGVLPPGADTVVIQENTRRDGDVIVVTQPAQAGKHVRRAGLDFARGEILLRKGRRLTARDLTLAAAMNHAALPVHRRARVAVLATGDELVLPGSTVAPAQIVYSNGYALAAMAQAEGAGVIDLGIAPDRLEDTAGAIRRAREADADVLVTAGGASVGDYDLVQQALLAEGTKLSFWRVALRPGKPLMHGRLGAMRVLGLPGNPVSAYVCALLFLVPLLRRLGGREDVGHETEPAVLGADLAVNDERTDYLRASLTEDADGRLVATPLPIQDSSMSASLARADCLIVREPFAVPTPAGAPCVILRLGH